jgi:hypothetical protein
MHRVPGFRVRPIEKPVDTGRTPMHKAALLHRCNCGGQVLATQQNIDVASGSNRSFVSLSDPGTYGVSI